MSNINLPSLIILARPPSPLTLDAIKAAYQQPLTAALTTLKSLELPRPAVLQVFVPCPHKYVLEEPRSQLFEDVEHLLAWVYSLVCRISASNAIQSYGSGGVDTRVILLSDDNREVSHGDQIGPMVDIQTLALSRRNWNFIFYMDSEKGPQTIDHYMEITRRLSPQVHGKICSIQSGISQSSSLQLQAYNDQLAIHTIVAVGGTFDHLHAGHKLLLTATALLLQPSTPAKSFQRRLIIGITGDSLLKNKKYAEYLQSWKERQEAVIDFMSTILFFAQSGGEGQVETHLFDESAVDGKAVHTRFRHAQTTIECVEIQDPFGPTITDETVSALVVSGETRSGGVAVNMKRAEKGWKPLDVFEVDVLEALGDKPLGGETNEFASKISSTAIRKLKADNAQILSL